MPVIESDHHRAGVLVGLGAAILAGAAVTASPPAPPTPPSPPGASAICVGDINIDGTTDLADFLDLTSHFGFSAGDPSYLAAADLDASGMIDAYDFASFAADYGCAAAIPTPSLHFSDPLDADGPLPFSGSAFDFRLVDTAGEPLFLGASLLEIANTDAAAPVFAVGDTITLTGAERSGLTIPDATFVIGPAPAGDGMTLQVFFEWMMAVTGIVPGGGVAPTDPIWVASGANMLGSAADVPAMFGDPASIRLTGNIGAANDLSIGSASFVVETASGLDSPFHPVRRDTASGASVVTTFTVFDSAANPLAVTVTAVLAWRDGDGAYWRVFLHSADDTDDRLHLECEGEPPHVPLIRYDASGVLETPAPIEIEIDRLDTGAATPQCIALTFPSVAG